MRVHAASFLGFALIASFASPSARASETDQYYAWGREIADSLEPANAKFNRDLEETLKAVNEHDHGQGYSCDQVVERIVTRFSCFVGKDWPELWATYSSEVARVPSDSKDARRYRKFALYGPTSLNDPALLPGVAPTLQINGVHFGADKLGHHFVEGGKYYHVYRDALESGATQAEAEDRAIDFGISLEKGKLGLATTGVFSNGDLEANYQGFRFYRSLCEEGGLAKTGNGWVLTAPYDARKYVNLDWDESLNQSAYTPFRWNKMKKRLVQYCPALRTPAIQALKREYQVHLASAASGSKLRILNLATHRLAPDSERQTLEALCAEENR